MTRKPQLTAAALLLALTMPATAFAFGELVPAQPQENVVNVNCSTTPQRRAAPIDRWGGPDPDFSYTYKFQPDGTARYSFTGRCQASMSNGSYIPVRYYVDASWDPHQKAALEVGRVYDLGNIAPEKYQPGPNSYTAFALRLVCPNDPWLNDVGCYVQTAATNHLEELVPRIKNGPFPLSAGALIYVIQVKLRAEYQQVMNTALMQRKLTQTPASASQFVSPALVSPTPGQRFFAQTVIPIKLAPPQGWSVAGYLVSIQKKDAAGNWIVQTNIPVPADQAQSAAGYTGFGSGGAGQSAVYYSSPGSWRITAQAASPRQSGWSNPVEFVIAAPLTPSNLKSRVLLNK